MPRVVPGCCFLLSGYGTVGLDVVLDYCVSFVWFLMLLVKENGCLWIVIEMCFWLTSFDTSVLCDCDAWICACCGRI